MANVGLNKYIESFLKEASGLGIAVAREDIKITEIKGDVTILANSLSNGQIELYYNPSQTFEFVFDKTLKEIFEKQISSYHNIKSFEALKRLQNINTEYNDISIAEGVIKSKTKDFKLAIDKSKTPQQNLDEYIKEYPNKPKKLELIVKESQDKAQKEHPERNFQKYNNLAHEIRLALFQQVGGEFSQDPNFQVNFTGFTDKKKAKFLISSDRLKERVEIIKDGSSEGLKQKILEYNFSKQLKPPSKEKEYNTKDVSTKAKTATPNSGAPESQYSRMPIFNMPTPKEETAFEALKSAVYHRTPGTEASKAPQKKDYSEMPQIPAVKKSEYASIPAEDIEKMNDKLQKNAEELKKEFMERFEKDHGWKASKDLEILYYPEEKVLGVFLNESNVYVKIDITPKKDFNAAFEGFVTACSEQVGEQKYLADTNALKVVIKHQLDELLIPNAPSSLAELDNLLKKNKAVTQKYINRELAKSLINEGADSTKVKTLAAFMYHAETGKTISPEEVKVTAEGSKFHFDFKDTSSRFDPEERKQDWENTWGLKSSVRKVSEFDPYYEKNSSEKKLEELRSNIRNPRAQAEYQEVLAKVYFNKMQKFSPVSFEDITVEKKEFDQYEIKIKIPSSPEISIIHSLNDNPNIRVQEIKGQYEKLHPPRKKAESHYAVMPNKERDSRPYEEREIPGETEGYPKIPTLTINLKELKIGENMPERRETKSVTPERTAFNLIRFRLQEEPMKKALDEWYKANPKNIIFTEDKELIISNLPLELGLGENIKLEINDSKQTRQALEKYLDKIPSVTKQALSPNNETSPMAHVNKVTEYVIKQLEDNYNLKLNPGNFVLHPETKKISIIQTNGSDFITEISYDAKSSPEQLFTNFVQACSSKVHLNAPDTPDLRVVIKSTLDQALATKDQAEQIKAIDVLKKMNKGVTEEYLNFELDKSLKSESPEKAKTLAALMYYSKTGKEISPEKIEISTSKSKKPTELIYDISFDGMPSKFHSTNQYWDNTWHLSKSPSPGAKIYTKVDLSEKETLSRQEYMKESLLKEEREYRERLAGSVALNLNKKNLGQKFDANNITIINLPEEGEYKIDVATNKNGLMSFTYSKGEEIEGLVDILAESYLKASVAERTYSPAIKEEIDANNLDRVQDNIIQSSKKSPKEKFKSENLNQSPIKTGPHDIDNKKWDQIYTYLNQNLFEPTKKLYPELDKLENDINTVQVLYENYKKSSEPDAPKSVKYYKQQLEEKTKAREEILGKCKNYEITTYAGVEKQFPEAFKTIRWQEKTPGIVSSDITNEEGEIVVSVKMKVNQPYNSSEPGKNHAVGRQFEELPKVEKGKGPVHTMFAFQDEEGQNVSKNNPAFLIIDYDEDGKIYDFSMPHPVRTLNQLDLSEKWLLENPIPENQKKDAVFTMRDGKKASPPINLEQLQVLTITKALERGEYKGRTVEGVLKEIKDNYNKRQLEEQKGKNLDKAEDSLISGGKETLTSKSVENQKIAKTDSNTPVKAEGVGKSIVAKASIEPDINKTWVRAHSVGSKLPESSLPSKSSKTKTKLTSTTPEVENKLKRKRYDPNITRGLVRAGGSEKQPLGSHRNLNSRTFSPDSSPGTGKSHKGKGSGPRLT